MAEPERVTAVFRPRLRVVDLRTRAEHLVTGAETTKESCKRLKDPIRDDTYHLEAFLPFRQAAKLERGNANVRPPNRSKPAYRDMLETVDSSPETFHLKNRGITYFCERFEFDNSNKTLTVTLPPLPRRRGDDDEGPRYGIADGGHTFGVIQDTVQHWDEFAARDTWTEPHVRVHFVTGTRNFATTDEEIVEALNTSSQVKQYTLDEYADKFAELKEALQKASFDIDLVAFRENEEKPWHVVEIIQRMACFLKERWELTQPASMYRSKSKALDLYTNDSSRGEFRRLYDVIYDVITLPEFIQATLSKGDVVPRRSLGRLRVVKPLKKPDCRPGTPYETEHKMDGAALLPMAAAFRELLVLKGDRYTWRVDPREALSLCAEQLYALLAARNAKLRSSSQLGADIEYWAGCVPIVMRTKDQLLDRAQNATARTRQAQ
jgi:AIPR protein